MSITLTWGVKQSFRAYVEAAGGEVTLGGGTTRGADGAFVFVTAADSASDTISKLGLSSQEHRQHPAVTGEGRFEGEVKFVAHGGMLSVFLADPRVESTAEGLVLTVADSPARDRRIAIVKLDAGAAGRDADGALTLPAAMTLDGMFLLGDHYPPGTVVDPVRLSARA